MKIEVLPSMEHTFTVKVKGSDTARIYEGTFSYRRPNQRAISEIEKTKARLNGDLKNLDEDQKFMHEIYATLRHTLSDVPEWWQKADFGFELYDGNIAIEIYKETRKFEADWRQKVWSDEEEKKPTS